MSPDWEKTDLQTIQPVTFHFQKPCLSICLNLSHVKDWSKFLCKKNVVVGGGGGGGEQLAERKWSYSKKEISQKMYHGC